MANLLEAAVLQKCKYRGSIEAWTNVYIYRVPFVQPPTQENMQQVAQEIYDNHNNILGASVQIQRVSFSTPEYLASDIEVFAQFEFDTAMPGTAPTMDPERAVLVQWPAGRNTKNRPVYLRKWYHPCNTSTVPATYDSSNMAQQSEIVASQRQQIETYAQNLAQVGPGPADFWELVSPTNRERTGPARCYPWLEHHELGEQWRS